MTHSSPIWLNGGCKKGFFYKGFSFWKDINCDQLMEIIYNKIRDNYYYIPLYLWILSLLSDLNPSDVLEHWSAPPDTVVT